LLRGGEATGESRERAEPLVDRSDEDDERPRDRDATGVRAQPLVEQRGALLVAETDADAREQDHRGQPGRIARQRREAVRGECVELAPRLGRPTGGAVEVRETAAPGGDDRGL